MKFLQRPYLSNLIAIKANKTISLRMSLGIKARPYIEDYTSKEIIRPTSPWQNLNFFEKLDYRVKVVGLSSESKVILAKEYNTDEYGLVSLKVPSTVGKHEIVSIQVYETSYQEGLELLLGSFIPMRLSTPSKILISDFDKTLVDTRYATPQEMMDSLRKPLSYFPTIKKSLDLLKSFIDDGFNTFILSASPHFYEKPIRDWLYKNEVYTSNIFLKDYRKIFSIFESELTTKDLKVQGFYKLNELVQIILMTGIPNELVLIGDGFESDSMIYLILRSILVERLDPWIVWKRVRKLGAFKLTNKQQSHFLTNLHLLASSEIPSGFSLQIYIRCKENNIDTIKSKKLEVEFLEKQRQFISYYQG